MTGTFRGHSAAAAKLLQSCLTLCNPIDGGPPGSPVPGFSRQEYWSEFPFPSPMHACMLSHFSRVRPCATLWTAAYQATPPIGFSRQEYWSGLPFLSTRGHSGCPFYIPLEKYSTRYQQPCPPCLHPMTQKWYKGASSLTPTQESCCCCCYVASGYPIFEISQSCGCDFCWGCISVKPFFPVQFCFFLFLFPPNCLSQDHCLHTNLHFRVSLLGIYIKKHSFPLSLECWVACCTGSCHDD